MKKIVLVCALALGVTAVSAQSEGMGMVFHPYVNVMAGSTSGSFKSEGVTPGVTSGKVTLNGFGYGLNVGAMFNKYFGAELNYTDFGTTTVKGEKKDGKVGTTAFGLNLKGVLPIADQFNAYAKVGYASGTATVTGRSKTSGDGFAYAVGFGYDIDKAMGVSLEYNALSFSKTQKAENGDGENSFKNTLSPSMIAATFTYNF
jgi:outer membrane protein W